MQIELLDWFGPLMVGLAGVGAFITGRWHSQRLLKKMDKDHKGQHPQPAE